MRRFQSAALAAVAVVGFASVSSAADMPTKAPVLKAAPAMAVPSWTGFYIGGDVGGAWTSNTGTWSIPASPNISTISGSNGGSGVIGGLYAGYNWQFAPTWVAGIEGDWSWTKASGSFSQVWTASATGLPFPGNITNTSMSSTLDWVASIRGRVGYLVIPNLLAYGTGGVAWGKFDYNGSALCSGPGCGGGGTYSANAALSSTQTGWTVGGGIEWAISNNWLLRGEYLYYRFNSGPSAVAQVALFPVNPSSFSWGSTNVSVARLGVSYKF